MSLSDAARKQGELWGIEAHAWATIQERTAPRLWRFVLDSLNVATQMRLLDAGCGSGGASVMASRFYGAIVSGCDLSEALLAIARKRLPQADLRIGELENLPFPETSFDAVMAINSIQFTPDPLRAAQELVRVTAQGGRIAVVVWAVEQCDQKQVFDAMIKLFDHPPKRRGVFALSSPGELEALFPGLTIETRELDSASVYPSFEIALRGQMAAGASQRVVELFGVERVEAAVRAALLPFVIPSGEVSMNNRYRCVVVRK